MKTITCSQCFCLHSAMNKLFSVRFKLEANTCVYLLTAYALLAKWSADERLVLPCSGHSFFLCDTDQLRYYQLCLQQQSSPEAAEVSLAATEIKTHTQITTCLHRKRGMQPKFKTCNVWECNLVMPTYKCQNVDLTFKEIHTPTHFWI